MKRGGVFALLLITLLAASGAGAQDETPVLTVEEHELVSAAVDMPLDMALKDSVTEDMLAVRQQWREPDPEIKLDATNAVIEQAGYQLVAQSDVHQEGTLYALTYNGSTLVSDVAYIWPIAVSASGKNFALLLDTNSTPTLMVTPETVGQMGMDFVYVAPVFVGEDLYTVEGDWEANTFTVSRNGEVVYTVAPPEITVAPPIKTLGSWDGHWVLENDGELVIDGESQNELLGYDAIFGWQLIAGQPFYFFTRDDQVGMSYAGEELPETYDEVQHYLCCEASMFNVRGNDSMVWFYALRGGMWYYVEAGVYDEK